MQLAPIPHNEADRQAALNYSHLLHADRAPFDTLTTLARSVFNVPMAFVSICDNDRQFLLSNNGFGDLLEGARDTSFCGHVLAEQMLVIEDARKDDRFADNPAVINEPHVRFYAGVPVSVQGDDGVSYPVGSFCVVDDQPREFSEEDRETLKQLGMVCDREIQLTRTTIKDSLTRLLNRHGLEEIGDRMVAAAKREFKPVTALFLDLDGFKAINTAIGHDRADLALKDFASTLRSVCRETDLCSRRSGDEFIVMMRSDAEGAAKLCDRLDKALAEHNKQTTLYQLRYSVGIATLKPKQSLEELLIKANEAMFQDKARRKEVA